MSKTKMSTPTPDASKEALRSDETSGASKWRRFKDAFKRAVTPAPEDTIRASAKRTCAKLQEWAARPADVMDAQRFCGRIVFWLLMISLLIVAVEMIDRAAFVSILLMVALAVTLAVKER